VLSSLLTSCESKAAGAVHRTLPAVLASLGMGIVLGPFAYRQFGLSGLTIVSSFAIAVVASILLAAWGAAKLSRNHEPVARLFASSGVRMVVPLMIAFAVVVAGGRIAPVESVYYVLPLYLCVLMIDVVNWVGEVKACVSGDPGHGLRRSIASGEDT
jgi:hypothetical protein